MQENTQSHLLTKVVLNGGGIQSTAMLALAAEGILDYKDFLMAITGPDSESPKEGEKNGSQFR